MKTPALVLDLDGTLIDSVYQHVLAWREALSEVGISLSVWRIHRKVGMSGGLLAQALLREIEHPLDDSIKDRLQDAHARAFARYAPTVGPLPGARELLAFLTEQEVSWAIATSSTLDTARETLETLGVADSASVITRDDVERAKPDPDLFVEAVRRLGVDVTNACVIGDSVWDLLAAKRARTLGVGLLSGGYGKEELVQAGAFRVYEDPADLLRHINEVGVRLPSW